MPKSRLPKGEQEAADYLLEELKIGRIMWTLSSSNYDSLDTFASMLGSGWTHLESADDLNEHQSRPHGDESAEHAAQPHQDRIAALRPDVTCNSLRPPNDVCARIALTSGASESSGARIRTVPARYRPSIKLPFLKSDPAY
jgi:hypothetical protein